MPLSYILNCKTDRDGHWVSYQDAVSTIGRYEAQEAELRAQIRRLEGAVNWHERHTVTQVDDDGQQGFLRPDVKE